MLLLSEPVINQDRLPIGFNITPQSTLPIIHSAVLSKAKAIAAVAALAPESIQTLTIDIQSGVAQHLNRLLFFVPCTKSPLSAQGVGSRFHMRVWWAHLTIIDSDGVSKDDRAIDITPMQCGWTVLNFEGPAIALFSCLQIGDLYSMPVSELSFIDTVQCFRPPPPPPLPPPHTQKLKSTENYLKTGLPDFEQLSRVIASMDNVVVNLPDWEL